MITRKSSLLFFLTILFVLPGILNAEFNDGDWVTVGRVIDGDTFETDQGESIRLAGVDTPETVHPNKPVEHYGPEASAFAKKILTGKKVQLFFDPSQRTGAYDRTIAYVHVDGFDFNAMLLTYGYAKVYRKRVDPRQERYIELERQAKLAEAGMWATEIKSENAPTLQKAKKDPTVYVTKTGSKYHRGSCSYLKKSKIPMKLSEAKKHYSPCSRCNPPR